MLQRTLHTNRGNANGYLDPTGVRSSPHGTVARPRLHASPSANFVRPEHASCGAYDKNLLLLRLTPPFSNASEPIASERSSCQVWGADEHVERLRIRAM